MRSFACCQRMKTKIRHLENTVILGKGYTIQAKTGLGFGDYNQILLGDENSYFDLVITGKTKPVEILTDKPGKVDIGIVKTHLRARGSI